jgi:hypothetical protein
MDTAILKTEVDSLETSKWAGTRWATGPFRRIANFSPAMQGQIFNRHRMRLAPPIDALWPERADATRLRLESEKIRIDPSCEGLLRQIQTAAWNETANDLLPTEDDGDHALVKALLLLVANVREKQGGSEAGKRMAKLLRGRRA